MALDLSKEAQAQMVVGLLKQFARNFDSYRKTLDDFALTSSALGLQAAFAAPGASIPAGVATTVAISDLEAVRVVAAGLKALIDANLTAQMKTQLDRVRLDIV